MTERHLIAYSLIALMLIVAGVGITRWRIAARKDQRRRRGLGKYDEKG